MSSPSPSSPTVSKFSFEPQYPDRDKDLEYELRRREMKKIQDARRRMMAGGFGGRVVEKKKSSNTNAYSNSRMNACDLTGEDFQIVCEELWIDFNSWVNHRSNFRDCVVKVRDAVVSKWSVVAPILVFLMWFRWYVGAGKDACSYSLGYGIFSFTCEVLRHLGEIIAISIMMLIGFCVGLTPIVACICIYEFKDAFPDPAEAEAEDDDNDSHLKKE